MPHVPYAPRSAPSRNIQQTRVAPLAPTGKEQRQENVAVPLLSIHKYEGPSPERLAELLRGPE
jgi:hypothetical protein